MHLSHSFTFSGLLYDFQIYLYWRRRMFVVWLQRVRISAKQGVVEQGEHLRQDQEGRQQQHTKGDRQGCGGLTSGEGLESGLRMRQVHQDDEPRVREQAPQEIWKHVYMRGRD